MEEYRQEVKGFRRRVERVQIYMDCHPRTGWWLAGIGIANIFLNLLDLVIR